MLKTVAFIIALISIPKAYSLETINSCLRVKIRSLVNEGCNFDPDPSLLTLFKKEGSISLDLNQGFATVEESTYVYPEAAFYKSYFQQAVSNPHHAYSGDVGTGMKYQGGFITVRSSFINICSDDGKKAAHMRYRGYFIVKDFGVNFTKDIIRRTAWQLICEEKIQVYSKLLSN